MKKAFGAILITVILIVCVVTLTVQRGENAMLEFPERPAEGCTVMSLEITDGKAQTEVIGTYNVNENVLTMNISALENAEPAESGESCTYTLPESIPNFYFSDTTQGLLLYLYGSAEESVLQAAETYMFITTFSFPFLGIYNSSAALFRSMKKTNMTMYVSLLMNVINIAGNAIGIFVLKAGVAGVAVPTLLSRAVAGIVMTALAFNAKHEVYLKAKNVFCRNFEMLRRILKIAIPNAIENGLFALGRVLVTSIVAMFGTAQIAANGVAGSVDLIAIIVVSAMNLAVVTVVGQCVGANRYDEAEHYLKKMMKVSWIATAVLTVLVWLCLPMILSCFAVSEETYHYAYILVMLHNIFATVLHPTSFNLPNGLRAAGDAKFTMYIGIGSMAMFRIGSAVLFGILLNMGVVGVWIAMGMDWLARSVAFVWRFKSKKWQKFRAI